MNFYTFDQIEAWWNYSLTVVWKYIRIIMSMLFPWALQIIRYFVLDNLQTKAKLTIVHEHGNILNLKSNFFFFFFFLIFRATPTAHGGSQASPELWLPASTTATAVWDPSNICNLHHSSRQRQILNPLREYRDGTHNLLVPSGIRFCCATTGTPF